MYNAFGYSCGGWSLNQSLNQRRFKPFFSSELPLFISTHMRLNPEWVLPLQYIIALRNTIVTSIILILLNELQKSDSHKQTNKQKPV